MTNCLWCRRTREINLRTISFIEYGKKGVGAKHGVPQLGPQLGYLLGPLSILQTEHDWHKSYVLCTCLMLQGCSTTTVKSMQPSPIQITHISCLIGKSLRHLNLIGRHIVPRSLIFNFHTTINIQPIWIESESLKANKIWGLFGDGCCVDKERNEMKQSRAHFFYKKIVH